MTDTQPLPADPTTIPATPAAPTAAPAPCVPSSMMNRILMLGILAGMIVFIGGVVLAFGESAENKLKFYQAAAFPFSVIVGSTLAALGFSGGKLLEGMVPAGYQPAARALITGVAARAGIPAAALVPILGPTPSTPEAPAAPAVPATPANQQPPTQPPTKTPMMSVMIPLLIGIAVLTGGCVNTSEPFKRSISGGIDNVVLDMRDYTALADWDTNHNGMIDVEEQAAKAKESADTEALAAAVADKSAITLEGVETPWRVIEPRYRHYIDTDPTLLTAEDKKTRTDTPDGINKLIDLERQRQRSLLAWFGI